MKIRANNILREYTPPPVVTSNSPSPSFPSLAATTTAALTAADSVPCLISEKCQQVARDKLPPDSEELSCDSAALGSSYFRCVCAKTRFLGHNDYFSAHCVFQECKGDGDRRAFIKQYKDGCKQIGESLADIPAEWTPFTRPRESSSSQRYPPSTTGSNTLASATSTSTEPSTTSDPTSSAISAETSFVPAPTPSTNQETPSPTPSSSPAAAILPIPQNTPNTAVIAGSAVSAIVIVVLLIGLTKLYYDTRKKAKQLRVANAQLEDATNPDGVSNRIVTLMAGCDRVSVASHRSSVSVARDAGAFSNGNVPLYSGEMVIGTAAQSSVSGGYTEYGSDKYDGFGSVYTGYGGENGDGATVSYDGGVVGAERRFSGVSESDYGSVRY
ncbi:hypothetical protein COCMIDRAFT_105556 [Bipolaris oryzae ATCC 44560]|uniref:Extracellular membrane protein CFEM domain-containing protein n=1 Tax=Bipolaris oryzae ATCC 44560 TaxID=930090 RepID=W6ZD32_COCMI|nr:uncharacterized protein COCMIDRAFT_105556 [Bipolaris oryzae ATCC 44560]EUC41656.1 hypothetical protein COCMIDRAFT_105556 [Bipolaris oryzae ATCC 44560]